MSSFFFDPLTFLTFRVFLSQEKSKMIKANFILESIKELLILNERNIANPEDLEGYIASVLKTRKFRRGDVTPEIERWFKTTVRKYLINDFPGVRVMHRKPVPLDPLYRKWMEKAFANGELVFYWVRGNIPFLDLEHILDYLAYAEQHARELPPSLRISNLSRLPFELIQNQASEWTDWFRTKDIDDEAADEGETLFAELKNGYTAVKVESKEALNREGVRMQHCVGSYANEVGRGTEIYSIRDASGKPHITIEYKNGIVNQFQGKQNTVPLEKYWEPLIEFLNILKPEIVHGLDKIGDPILFEGKFYKTPEDLPSHYWKGEDALGQLVYQAIDRANINLIKYYLKRGVDPNKSPNGEDYPILWAVVQAAAGESWSSLNAKKQLEVVKLLIQHGVNLEVKDHQGRTPLDIAVERHGVDVAKVLLDAGAKTDGLSWVKVRPSSTFKEMRDLILPYLDKK